MMALFSMVLSLVFNLTSDEKFSPLIFSLEAFLVVVKFAIALCGRYSLGALNKLNRTSTVVYRK